MQTRLISAFRRTACQHEAPITIAAIDVAVLIDFQPDARVAQRSPAGDAAGPITFDAVAGGQDGFRCVAHAHALAATAAEFQLTGQLIGKLA